jgi:hypothetical protein
MQGDKEVVVTIDSDLWELMVDLTIKHFDGLIRHEWGISRETERSLDLLTSAVKSSREVQR